MVTVIFDGNLGNNLFQYAFGYLLASMLGFKLNSPSIEGFPNTFLDLDGIDNSRQPILLVNGHFVNIHALRELATGKHVVLVGYFQRSNYYEPSRNLLRTLFSSDHLKKPVIKTTDYVSVVLRRGLDYLPRHGIPYEYYVKALSLLPNLPIFICTDSPSDMMVNRLSSAYDATILPTDKFMNLNAIVHAKYVITANSSFAWWGAFLSTANRIIFPQPLIGFWSRHDRISRGIDLFFGKPDNSIIKCKPYIPMTCEEYVICASNVARNIYSSAVGLQLERRKMIRQGFYSINFQDFLS